MDATPLTPEQTPPGRHLGDLVKHEAHWRVYLETRPDGQLVSGRVHFASETRTRSSAWIFLEWSEQDAINRFNEFSPVELWKLLESLS